ncbi:putative protein kinase CAMK-CAMKL-CHK1 family [Helianthus annuus]|nr:putative protein kinase CAMK-CAMKL-CHK1 family [Helianthus annuus]
MEDCADYCHVSAGGRNIIFGKYEMGRMLGQGTFAKVYYAKDVFTSESVAIKVIKKDQVRKEGLMDQITREISVMRLVRHPNVVELKEVMATKKKIFFVMEYVTGGELFAKVLKGRLKEDVARKYFQQLISAVDFCHSRGVSHRDLKPENLLLDENGDLKVSDFGLSSLPEHSRNDGCYTPSVELRRMSRRKFSGEKAGFLPFQDENVMHMYKKIFKAEYEYPPWFSADARRLISKILIVDPSRRITIPAIMRSPWFSKGFQRPLAFSIKETDDCGVETEITKTKSVSESDSAPPFYNAFEFISSMSSGFDLSNMFESKRKPGSLFTSKYSASSIVNKLESAAKKLNLKMLKSKQNDYKVKMQGMSEGRKGKLSVTVEVFEVAPEVTVVEFSKSAGDTLEYKKFCEDDVRPALKDIVWKWQGEDNICN